MAVDRNVKSQRRQDDRDIFGYSLLGSHTFTGAAGTALIAGACFSLSNAVILCLLVIAAMTVVGVAACREAERIDPRRRIAFFISISGLSVFVISLIINNVIDQSVAALGIFAPLAAFDSLVLHRVSHDAPILLMRETVYESMGNGLCFALCALPVALVRELLGSGSFFGLDLGYDGCSALKMPFFGFILCGFTVAVLRYIMCHGSPDAHNYAFTVGKTENGERETEDTRHNIFDWRGDEPGAEQTRKGDII